MCTKDYIPMIKMAVMPICNKITSPLLQNQESFEVKLGALGTQGLPNLFK